MNKVEYIKLSSDLFDAMVVAEALSASDVEFAKFLRAIVKSTPKEHRDIAFLAIIAYFKSK